MAKRVTAFTFRSRMCLFIERFHYAIERHQPRWRIVGDFPNVGIRTIPRELIMTRFQKVPLIEGQFNLIKKLSSMALLFKESNNLKISYMLWVVVEKFQTSIDIAFSDFDYDHIRKYHKDKNYMFSHLSINKCNNIKLRKF